MLKREKSLVEHENVESCRLLQGMVDDLVETRKKVADFEENWKAVLKPLGRCQREYLYIRPEANAWRS